MSPDEPGSSWLLMEILVEVFWTKRSSEQEQIWDKRSKLQKPSPRSIIVVTFTFPSRPENVLHCPPLSEGEGLACRVLQVNPFIIHIIMFYTCVFVFDLIMCNVYCMYSYLILHLPILQLYIYTFAVFYVFMFAFVPLKKLWKRCPLSWPRPSFWLRCSSRCRTSHPSERRGGWRQCHQHHHHQWPSSSSTSLFHFHLSANSNSVGSDFREIVVMRSDSGKKWCLHHNRWVSEKQHNLRAENNLKFFYQQCRDWPLDCISGNQVVVFLHFILISILTIRIHHSLWIKIWLSRCYCVISIKYSSLSRKMMFCPTQTTCVCILWHVQKVDGPTGQKYISGPESQTFFLLIFRKCILTLIAAFMCRLHHRDICWRRK